MAEINTNKLRHDQAYEARGVVARYHQMGHFQQGLMQVPVWKFLTLDRGKGEYIPVEFVKPAPVKADKGESILDMEALQEGDIVVHPGLVYRKTFWHANLMAAHMKALQTYRPKDIITSEKADAPAIDLGQMDFTQDQVTKQ